VACSQIYVRVDIGNQNGLNLCVSVLDNHTYININYVIFSNESDQILCPRPESQ